MNGVFAAIALVVAGCSGDSSGGTTNINNPPPTTVVVASPVPGSCVEVGSAEVKDGSFIIVAACIDGQGNSAPFCFNDNTRELINCPPSTTTQTATLPPAA